MEGQSKGLGVGARWILEVRVPDIHGRAATLSAVGCLLSSLYWALLTLSALPLETQVIWGQHSSILVHSALPSSEFDPMLKLRHFPFFPF